MLIKIPVNGKAECNFWVRAFQLEDEVGEVMRLLGEDDRRKRAFAPTITQHESGSIQWVIFLGLMVDSLGVCGGDGYVWLTTGKDHFEQALKKRNELGEYVIKEAERQGKFDEIMEIEEKKDV